MRPTRRSKGRNPEQHHVRRHRLYLCTYYERRKGADVEGGQSKLGVSSPKLANIAVVNIRHPAIIILDVFGGKAPVLKYAVWRSEQ